MTINVNEALDRIKNSTFGKDVRQAIFDAITAAYNDATLVGNSDMEVSAARGLFKSLLDRLNSSDTSINDVKTQISNLASGAPKGTYATTSALQTAFPTGNNNVYVVTADGKWYYWSGSAWTAGGTYQATAIASKTVEGKMMKDGEIAYYHTNFLELGKNLFNKDSANNTIGYYMEANGIQSASSSYNISHYIPVKSGVTYALTMARKLTFFNTDMAVVTANGIDINPAAAITYTPTADGYIRVSFNIANWTNAQVEIGGTQSTYEAFKRKVKKLELDDNTVKTSSIIDKNVTNSKLGDQSVDGRTVKPGEIRHYHTAFMDVGKNLANKTDSDVLMGYYLNHTDGTQLAGSFNTTGWITVKAGVTYAISKCRKVLVYDTSKVFKASESLDVLNVVTTVTPTTDGFIRVSFGTGDWALAQVEANSVQTAYEDYYRTVKNILVPDGGIGKNAVGSSNLKMNAVGVEHTNFFVIGKNLFNKNDANNIMGYYIETLSGNGSLQASSSYNTSHYIPVKAGVTYAVSLVRKVVVYDSSYRYITAQTLDVNPAAPTTVTPQQDGYVRLSFGTGSYWESGQFEVGSSQTAYEPYSKTINGLQMGASNLPDGSLTGSKFAKDSIGADQVDFVGIGKNLFNADARLLDYFIGGYTGALQTGSPATYDTTDYIPIKSGVTYAITLCRKVLAYDSNKVPIQASYQDVLPQAPTTHTATQDGYLRVSFAKTAVGGAQVEVGDVQTSYEPYGLQLSEAIVIGPENLSDDIMNSITSGSSKITVANAEKIGFVADSYTEGFYAVRGKNYINKLSLFSDYNYENFGKGGDTYRGNIDRIRKKQGQFHPTLSWQDFKPKYAVMAAGTNDSSYMTLEQFGNDLRAAIETVQQLGAIPIISTVHHTSSLGANVISLYQQIAKEYDIDFMNHLPLISRTWKGSYTPFWVGGHPGTRPNAMLADAMERYLSRLPRPRQSLKIFRKRDFVDGTSLDNLIFGNNVERAKKFREIQVGHSALVDPKNVDNVTNAPVANITSEYLKIQNGESVAFTDFALINAILPATSLNLSSVSLNINETTGKVYVKNSLASPYPSPTMYTSFEMADPSVFKVGDTYTSSDSAYSGVTFTVQQVKSDRVLMSPQKGGTNNAGTLTKVTGTGPASVTYNYTSVGFADGYPTGKQNIGHWVEVALGADGKYTVPATIIKNVVDYDRIAFLVQKSGSFNLSKVEVEWSGKEDKVYKSRTLKVPDATGTEMLTKTLVDSGNISGWTIDGTATPYTPADGMLPKDTTACVDVTTVNKISQSFTYTDPYSDDTEVEIRVSARYFPAINDPAGSTFTITEDTYDYADLAVDVNVTGQTYVHTVVDRVNTHWKEVVFRTYLPHGTTGQNIKIYSKDKTIQIAKVSVKRV